MPLQEEEERRLLKMVYEEHGDVKAFLDRISPNPEDHAILLLDHYRNNPHSKADHFYKEVVQGNFTEDGILKYKQKLALLRKGIDTEQTDRIFDFCARVLEINKMNIDSTAIHRGFREMWDTLPEAKAKCEEFVDKGDIYGLVSYLYDNSFVYYTYTEGTSEHASLKLLMVSYLRTIESRMLKILEALPPATLRNCEFGFDVLNVLKEHTKAETRR